MPYQCDIDDPAKAADNVLQLTSTLKTCREKGVRVIFTAHVHRRDGSDMSLFDDLCPPIADRSSLVDNTPGADIFLDLVPAPGEHVIKKHKCSGFSGTDLDIILRERGIDTVVITGLHRSTES